MPGGHFCTHQCFILVARKNEIILHNSEYAFYTLLTFPGFIYIYIKWTVFVNVTTKSAQHAHARMIAIIVEKSPNNACTNLSWRQPFCKGRISCLWIKSVFDCLTIGIIHETMVVHMTWVWTFFNNYIYMYIYIYMCVCVSTDILQVSMLISHCYGWRTITSKRGSLYKCSNKHA